MLRRARRDLGSSYLHVIVQGIEKKYIFEKEQYKKEFKKLMINKAKVYDVKLLGYCVMDNHTHILLFSENIKEVGKYMKAVNTSFAHFYNKMEKRVGYVFRDRYLSEPIKTERQLYNCLVYIHYNPVEAGIVELLEQYRYSSYCGYIEKNDIVNDEIIKLVFGSCYDYMNMFKFIHYGVGEAKEPVVEKKNDSEKVIKMSCVTKEECIKECIRLKAMNISNRKIAEILQIGRNRVNKIIKEKCQ